MASDRAGIRVQQAKAEARDVGTRVGSVGPQGAEAAAMHGPWGVQAPGSLSGGATPPGRGLHSAQEALLLRI